MKLGPIFLSLAIPALGQPVQERSLALAGVTVIDGTGGTPRKNMTVVITGEHITAIVPSEGAHLGGDTDVEDCSGKFLIPGLWDMHVHSTDDLTAPLYVANGVTGVRHMAGDLIAIDWLRRNIETGRIMGPRIFRAGPFVDGAKPGLANRLLISTPDEGRDAVHFLKRMNVDFIKVHTGVPREAYMALMEEANREGMAVVGHVPLAVTAAAASDAGQRMIEHMSSLAEPRTIQLVETE